MPYRISRRATVALLAFTDLGAPSARPRAETLSETDVERRTLLLFRAPDSAVQALLPGGWQSSPLPGGPGQGANLNVVFADRLSNRNAEGQSIPGGGTPNIVLAAAARNPTTGAAGSMVAAVFSVAEAVPGPYDVGIPADVTMKRATETETGQPRHVQEQWSLTTDDHGDHLEMRLRYTATPPTRVMQQQHTHSTRHADFYRIYRIDQGVDALRGAGVPDRVEDLSFTAKGPHFDKLFDGSERLVAVLSLPWYLRQVSLP